MEILRIRDTNTLKPLHAVAIALVIGTLGGVFLLLSAQESLVPIDGAIPWHAESPLRAVVRLLSLNYAYPTIYQGDLKNFVLGVGAGLLSLSIGIALLAGRREDETVDSSRPDVAPTGKKHIAPLFAAQAMFGLYVLWSFASARWSTSAGIAIGGSALLAIHLIWAFAISQSLSIRAARMATLALVGLTGITAIIALWYFYGRNPNLRAKFPFGNPTFLAGCFIPGIVVGFYAGIDAFRKSLEPKNLILGIAMICSAALSTWAFWLADSRGPMAGLAFACLATIFFALRGKWRILPAAAGAILAVAGVIAILQMANAPSETGRDSTLRSRFYTFSYAWQMFTERPLVGHGQGGFVLNGDGYAINDVLEDPEPFRSRLAHAHNEWLEVLANLGITGLLLVISAILMTIRAGWDACRSDKAELLVPLLGALVGMSIDACASVGLRVSAVGAVYFLVIGLIWAFSASPATNLFERMMAVRGRQLGSGIAMVIIGMAALVAGFTDFQAARSGYESYRIMTTEKVDETVRLA
ncbi:MAG: O-antigen ligase family protein, partial [Phycisphaerae bacterium]